MKVYIVETWYPGEDGSVQIDSIFLSEDKAKERVDNIEAEDRKKQGKNYTWCGKRATHNEHEVTE